MTPTSQTITLETGTGTLPARLYGSRPAKGSAPLVFHLHGGAFTGGTLECGAYISGILAAAGAVVVSADYPLACEHPFPFALTALFAAVTDVYRRRAELAGRGAPLYLAGEESGGNLAAGLAMMARDQHSPPIAGQILVSPMLDPSLATASIRRADAGSCGCKWADGWQTYLGSPEKAAHPYAAPLASSRLGALPPALVVSAEDCPMCDESRRYADALASAGVPTCVHILQGPTEWPDSISCPAPKPATWTGAMRDLFRDFFVSTRPASRTGRLKADPAVL